MSKLDPFFDAVAEIPNKNYGGCLVFCFLFYLWLKKNGMDTDSFEIKQYEAGYEYGHILNNMEWINGVEGDVLSSYHFTWFYEGVEYDAEGRIEDSECCVDDMYGEVLYGLTTRHVDLVKDFCLDALNAPQWNFVFDREAAHAVIMENLGIDLAEEGVALEV